MAQYTLEQVRAAIQNARAAGNTQAADRLFRYAVELRQKQEPQERHDATDDMSSVQKLLAGIGQGMVNVGRHAGNLVGLVSDEKLADAKALDENLLNTTQGKIGSVIGETAITAPLMAGGAGLAARAGSGAARVLANPVSRGVAEGAAQGALMADPGEKGAGAVLGGLAGGVLPAAVKGGSTIARGVTRTPEAQRLLDAGVDLTPGQMNPGGAMNYFEQSFQDLAPPIKAARENARSTFQKAATEAGAAPGAKITKAAADDMLDQAYRSFEPLYDQARGFPVRPYVMTNTGTDVPLATLFKRAAATKRVPATDASRERALSILRNELSAGVSTSDDLLRMRSNIRAAARKARSGTESLQHDTADLLDEAESAITAALESQLPADAMQAVRIADSKYGAYKTIEEAVARAKDKPGGFTPNDLAEAISKTMGQGAGRGSYARGGGGDLRDLAQAGRSTLDVTAPSTGGRVGAWALGGAVGLAAPQVAIPAALTAMALSGTRTGRRFAAGNTAAQRTIQGLSDRAQGNLTEQQRRALAQTLRALSVASQRQMLVDE